MLRVGPLPKWRFRVPHQEWYQCGGGGQLLMLWEVRDGPAARQRELWVSMGQAGGKWALRAPERPLPLSSFTWNPLPFPRAVPLRTAFLPSLGQCDLTF